MILIPRSCTAIMLVAICQALCAPTVKAQTLKNDDILVEKGAYFRTAIDVMLQPESYGSFEHRIEFVKQVQGATTFKDEAALIELFSVLMDHVKSSDDPSSPPLKELILKHKEGFGPWQAVAKKMAETENFDGIGQIFAESFKTLTNQDQVEYMPHGMILVTLMGFRSLPDDRFLEAFETSSTHPNSTSSNTLTQDYLRLYFDVIFYQSEKKKDPKARLKLIRGYGPFKPDVSRFLDEHPVPTDKELEQFLATLRHRKSR